MKQCRRCDATKPASDFHGDRRAADGLRTWCKGCWNAYQRERWSTGRTDRAKKTSADKAWRKANPDRQAAIHRRSRLKRSYQLSVEQYDAMLARQRGACAVCGSTDTGDRRYDSFPVDHDHRTGRIRGLLCSPCNLAIGHAGDDPERLLALAAYLIQRTDVLSAAHIGASA